MSNSQSEPRKIFCEICNRVLLPGNMEDVKKGLTEHFVYVHDDVDHGSKPLHEIIATVQ